MTGIKRQMIKDMEEKKKKSIEDLEKVKEDAATKVAHLQDTSNAVKTEVKQLAKEAFTIHTGSDDFNNSIRKICTNHINDKIKKDSSMSKEPVNEYLEENGMCTKAEAKKQAWSAITEYIQEDSTNELKSFVTDIIDSHSSKATAQIKHSQATPFGTGNDPDMRPFREEIGSGYDQDDDPDDDPRDTSAKRYRVAREHLIDDQRY